MRSLHDLLFGAVVVNLCWAPLNKARKREDKREGERRLGGTQWEKRSLSEFIKYQGKICGAGKARRARGRVPLITSDSEAGTPRRCSWLQRRVLTELVGLPIRNPRRGGKKAEPKSSRPALLSLAQVFHSKTPFLFRNDHSHVGLNELRWWVAKARSFCSRALAFMFVVLQLAQLCQIRVEEW